MSTRDFQNHRIIKLCKFIFSTSFLSICILIHLLGCSSDTNQYSRGIGIYPGDPEEDFSPVLEIDHLTYRNLAFHRPAYHSSSYDYNLTAQLITDGIKDRELPVWFSASTSQHGTLPKNEREWMIDFNRMTSIAIDSSSGWIQIDLFGAGIVPKVDSVVLGAGIQLDERKSLGWSCIFMGSDDGENWQELGLIKGNDYPGDTLPGRWRRFAPTRFRIFNESLILDSPVEKRHYKVSFKAPNAINWSFGGIDLYFEGSWVKIAPSFHFTSVWKSAGIEDEWVYVDLGAVCTFDKVNLHWIRRSTIGSIQVSDDAVSWKNIQELKLKDNVLDEFSFDTPINGRYVRVLMEETIHPEGYLLSEIEVYGRGGPVALPHDSPEIKDDRRIDLAGGNWRIQRASLVNEGGETLSKSGFDDSNWVIATVPGTVLMSYRNVGGLPDPNFGDNQLMISESFFISDFWYRNQFNIPSSYGGDRVFLNFDGINWKVEIYFNGCRVGRIEGAFTGSKFDITEVINPGEINVLVVKIEKNATPGNVKEQTVLSTDKNGGALGADNPTFHASVGWDWIPTIRGRNIGIWNDVFLTRTGTVTIEEPFVTTEIPLPDTSFAEIKFSIKLRNHDSQVVKGLLVGQFGEISFEQPVTMEAFEEKIFSLNAETHQQLALKNPKLWWPAGYGDPNLYVVNLRFEDSDGKMSDIKSFKTGVREMTYSEDGGTLRIWINGRRFIGRGGNWGFSESNLAYREREYDIAVRYHKDMNFTMIRNWVGQTGDDEFFEACDRHGIMIWQDFWLANPVDGPNPEDNELFMQNLEDFVLRIRNHPSIALYVGRNEGNPPEVLDTAIRHVLPDLHPGIHYISNSAFGVVSGGGHYRSLPPKLYFESRATPKFHSEMGMPNIVTYESLLKMIPEAAMWPKDRLWGIHDFCLEGAQGGASFNHQMGISFGDISNAKQWTELAQWINYRGYRAMFEAQSKYRMGLLLWMSHAAWPSLVWQTYDYYFEPTAAYFACKKASEPLHIQWNSLTDSIEVVNYHSREGLDLTASVQLINMDGSVKWEQNTKLDCPADSTVKCFSMKYPGNLSDVHFIKLKLRNENKILSENFYWRGLEKNNEKLPDYRFYRDLKEHNLTSLFNLPKVNLESGTQVKRNGDKWLLSTNLNNTTKFPVLMVRLKVVRENSGDRILPVIYSDNYVSLMPGEQCTIRMELNQADTRGEKPKVVISGFNVIDGLN